MIDQFPMLIDVADCHRLRRAYDRDAAADVKYVYRDRFRAGSAAAEIIDRITELAQLRASSVMPLIEPETVLMARLGVGHFHSKHADCERLTADGRWVPNHTPHRCMSAIVYLNDDFEGGEIVFEQHGLTIKPRPGLMLVFPSDRHHLHEVRPVTAGTRYNISIWFKRSE